MIAFSRMFGFFVDGQKDDALIPLAGMFNNSRAALTGWGYDDKKKGFTYKALEDIPRDSVLLTSYGNKDNLNFFVFYGFVNDSNPDNIIRMHFKLNANDPMYIVKNQMVSGHAG